MLKRHLTLSVVCSLIGLHPLVAQRGLARVRGVVFDSLRGKPLGPAIRGVGRVLPQDEWPHAEEALVAAYRGGRKVFERTLGGPDDMAAYVEISPAAPTSG